MQNSTENKILIVDPVGCKAGMDYYDNSLVLGFQQQGMSGYIASNYEEPTTNAKIFFRSNNLKGKFAKLLDWIRGCWKAFSYAKHHKIQYILLHSFSSELKDIYPYLLSKIFTINIITIVHDVSGFGQGDNTFVRKLIYKYSNYLVVHNEHSKAILTTFLDHRYHHKLFVIPHGHFLDLPTPLVNKAMARKQLSIPEDEKMILFFGQIKKQKGLDLLLRALPHIDRTVKLSIAGKPWKDDFDNYNQIINDLNLETRVRKLIRYIDDDERDLFFKAADIVVIPYYEIYQSGVLLMAMSYGVPVLASNLRPNGEIIRHLKNGLLFTSGDYLNLAENVNIFFDKKEELNYLSENSIRFLKEKHDWQIIAGKYKKMIIG